MDLLKLNTALGVASYPHITSPDTFMGKEQYKCDLRLDPTKDDAKAFIAKVEAYVEKAKVEALVELQGKLDALDSNSANPTVKKACKALATQIEDLDEDYRSPLIDEYDKASGEATGLVLFKMKSNASFVTKDKDKKTIMLTPQLFDAEGKQITGERPLIKGGSKLIIQTSLSAYVAGFGCGVSARMGATQIIKLSQGNSEAAFGAVDGGFVQEEKEEAPSFAAVDPSEDSGY